MSALSAWASCSSCFWTLGRWSDGGRTGLCLEKASVENVPNDIRAVAALTSFRKESNMTSWLIRGFTFLLLMLPFVPAVADDPDDKEIARLVKQLGSSDFRIREAARKKL